VNAMRKTLCLMLVVLAGCAKTPDVEQIQAQIEQQEVSAEAGEIGRFMDGIAEDFSGQQGALDAQGLRDMLRVQLLANTRIKVALSGVKVEVTGDTATAEFSALLTGGPGFIPDAGKLVQVATAWRKIDGQWQVVNATWDPPTG